MTRTPDPHALTYADSGVDIDAGNAMVEAIKPLVRATRRPGADAEIGGFGGLFDLKAAGFVDPVLVAANDGVGTKVKIAIESGILDTIGVDLVAMCVNDIVVQGAEPLFFLDYFATGRLDPAEGAAIVKGIAAACVESGCALIGGETAEMPGLYAKGDFDLAGFAVGAAERGTLLPREGLKAGDLVIGLPSSGVHSNGFSLVRRIVARSGLAWDAPAPFAPGTLAAALLTPTRLYVKPLLAALKACPGLLALAHVTGGGFPPPPPPPTTCRAFCRMRSAWNSTSTPSFHRRCFPGSPKSAAWTRRRCCERSTADSAWWRSSRRRPQPRRSASSRGKTSRRRRSGGWSRVAWTA